MFCKDWQNALGMRPPIAYFKMKEANALTGEFEFWSESRRNERVALLFSIVENHALFGVSTAAPHDVYQSVFVGNLDSSTRFLEHPYCLMLFGIVTSIASCAVTSGEKEPIEFVFDSQPDQMNRILAGWELFVSVSREDLKPFLSRPPVFRDDKTALPLQAADLHAWWTRRMCEAYFFGKADLKPSFPGGRDSLSIRCVEKILDRRFLAKNACVFVGSNSYLLSPQITQRYPANPLGTRTTGINRPIQT
ncbi:hypothetical protein Q3C01_08665 [Bradyrhizobium sp. UFLA05-109]